MNNNNSKSRYEVTMNGKNLFTIILNDNGSITEVTELNTETLCLENENRDTIIEYHCSVKKMASDKKMIDTDKRFVEFLLTELSILVPLIKFKYYESDEANNKLANAIDRCMSEDYKNMND